MNDFSNDNRWQLEQRVKAWFWPRVGMFPSFQMQTKNRTAGRKVPISAVQKAVGVKKYQVVDPRREATA
jgi:hypothetical protein